MYDLHIDRAQLLEHYHPKTQSCCGRVHWKSIRKTAQITNHLRNVWQVKDDDAQNHLDGRLDEFAVINGEWSHIEGKGVLIAVPISVRH